MDFRSFTDTVRMPCCVISVEKKGGSYGVIRILCANEAYKEIMGPAYYDNMPYYELVPQDNKFEDYCFRAAVLGQRMHAYVETRALNAWTDQTLIPLMSDRDDMGYCQYIFEFTKGPETGRMTSVSNEVATTVLKAGMTIIRGERFHESLNEVIDIIVEMSGAEGCRALYIDHENRKIINYAEKRLGHFRDLDGDVITYDLVSTWEALIGVSDAIIISNERDMDRIAEADPVWAESMRESGVKNLVLVPLHRERSVVGYLYVVNFNIDKVVEVKEALQMISYILGTEIANHHLVRKLDEISNVDALTGVGSRRAMQHKMDIIKNGSAETPFGIVNIDLNGLKRVNDEEGHEAGDRLLRQAGEVIRKVYYEDDVYRTGGDEFVVIMYDIDKEAFDRKFKKLREDMEKNADVSFAMGGCWSDGGTDLKEAFRTADERMYRDKDEYYETHQDKKRRY